MSTTMSSTTLLNSKTREEKPVKKSQGQVFSYAEGNNRLASVVLRPFCVKVITIFASESDSDVTEVSVRFQLERSPVNGPQTDSS